MESRGSSLVAKEALVAEENSGGVAEDEVEVMEPENSEPEHITETPVAETEQTPMLKQNSNLAEVIEFQCLR